MNAPERIGLPDALATLSICYAPLIDKHRRAIGTRLTMLSARAPGYLPVGHIPYGQGNEGGPMSRGANAWVQTWFLNFGPTKKMIPNWYEWPIAEGYIDFSVYPMINENCFNQTEVPAACYWFWLASRERG